jgi:hypothetical protein
LMTGCSVVVVVAMVSPLFRVPRIDAGDAASVQVC